MITEIFNIVILPNLVIFAGLYIAVLLAIIADLVSGCRKARKEGFLRSSKGLRRTVKKTAEYYNLMFVISIIDIVIMVAVLIADWSIPEMPFLSFIATIFLCIIELKSIYERRTEKDRANMETVAKFIVKAYKDKDAQDFINLLSEAIDEK